MHNFLDILSSTRRLRKGEDVGKSLTGKELGKGITQRRDKIYQGSFVGRDGRRKTVYSKDLKEVKAKLKDAKEGGRTYTLQAWFDEWLSVYKKNLRDTTKVCYTTSFNRIGRVLGRVDISELNLLDLQRAFNEFPSDMARKMTRMVLKNALGDAVKSGIIEKNVADGINIHVTDDLNKEERRVLTKEETEWLKDAISSYRHRDALLLSLQTGMRINEVLGLTKDCLDFENGIIYVKQSLACVNGSYLLHKPKTKSGRRVIPMNDAAKDILTRNLKEGFLFVTKLGTPVSYRMIDGDLKKFSAEIERRHPGFKRVTAHTLRHTFATRCIENGMNPKTLQKILGHASLNMTMDLYCHVTYDTVVTEMQKCCSKGF